MQLKNLKGRERFGDIDIDGRIILKWFLRNGLRGCGNNSSVSEVCSVMEKETKPLITRRRRTVD
jgi:hypothetical protein